MNKRFGLALAVVGLLTGCAASNNYNAQEDTIKISKVVMYQSGVGYVERAGSVDGDSISLSIRSDQINDILKSLTVIDRSNGRPVSISLPVDRGSLKTADVPEGGLLQMFQSFRGAHVTVEAKGRSTVEGRIVGVEANPAANSDGQMITENWKLTIVDQDDILHVFDYASIESVSLHDRSLADGLARSLDVSLNDGDWKQVEISIQLDGAQKRDVALSYIVAMPTWKPAYRLVLSDDGKSVLQGWAVISNVSGSDWEDIDFSLVSGQPMSFTYDLYTPQYLERPDLTDRAQKRAIAPKVTKSGYATKSATRDMARNDTFATADFVQEEAEWLADADESVSMKREAAPMAAKKSSGGMSNSSFAARYEESPVESVVNQDYGSNVDMAQVGAFDTYTLASTLSVKDSSTALVNLLQHELPAKEVRLFESTNNGEQSDSWQTIQLKNDAEMALEPGPITIYHGSTFVGEGYLSRTAPGSTAQLTFAAESRVTLAQRYLETKNDYMLKSISRGRANYEYNQVRTYTFDVNSHASEPLTVVAQIPRASCFEPVDFPEDSVKTDSTISVPIDVEASAKKTVEYKAKCLKQGSIGLESSIAVDAIDNAIKAGTLPSDKVETLSEFVRLYRENQKLLDDMNSKENVKSSLERDQDEITWSLKDLKNVKSASAEKLKNQLIARQSSNEKQIASLATELTEMRVRVSENEIAIKAVVRTMEL